MADSIMSDGVKTVVLDNEERNRGPNWSAEPTFGQTQTVRAIGDTGHHILNALRTEAVQTAGGHNVLLNNQGNIRSDVRDVGHNVSRDVTSGQREILTTIGNVRDAVREESGKLSKDICDTRDAVRTDGSITRERVQTEGRFNAEAFSTIRREIATVESVLRKDLCDTNLNVTKEACETREVVKDRTDQLARQGLQHFADLRLQASENTARLSKELADCCCEVKELVRAEGTATRELIQATENARLRDSLADSKAEINQQGLLNAILQIANRGN